MKLMWFIQQWAQLRQNLYLSKECLNTVSRFLLQELSYISARALACVPFIACPLVWQSVLRTLSAGRTCHLWAIGRKGRADVTSPLGRQKSTSQEWWSACKWRAKASLLPPLITKLGSKTVPSVLIFFCHVCWKWENLLSPHALMCESGLKGSMGSKHLGFTVKKLTSLRALQNPHILDMHFECHFINKLLISDWTHQPYCCRPAPLLTTLGTLSNRTVWESTASLSWRDALTAILPLPSCHKGSACF